MNERVIYSYFFVFSEKYAKFNFCIDVNSHVLPTENPSAVLRTAVMSSHASCLKGMRSRRKTVRLVKPDNVVGITVRGI